jgi:hypothetical protein
MQFQVLVRIRETWQRFGAPTDDEEDARWFAGLAATSSPNMQVRVLSAPTFCELEQLCDQWTHNQSGHTSRLALHSAADWNTLMDAVELGQGGDHNTAYRFQAPDHSRLSAAWVRLAARVARGELGGASDGAHATTLAW